MPNLEVLVSPQDLITLRSIYSRQKRIEENIHVWWFPRYLPISIQY